METSFESSRELEMLSEEKRLKDTIEIINDEILTNIDKRKYITEYILDYRKNVIDEYRDDEDKLIEYFDHERYVREEAFKTIDRKLRELTILKETPYFGRVTFKEEEEADKDTLYIGRFGLTPDGSFEPVVVDWRAPVAALFYHGSLGKATYESPMGPINTEILGRRQLIVKKGKLQGMFDSAIDVKDEILQMVLSSNSSDKLKDIIMTIQEEQDAIIRRPRENTVVVNGVAGSGKTTIALHRVAYLLYNYRKTLGDKVLILGPNNIFNEYISHVLPSLGEVGVKQETFVNFALRESGIYDEVMDYTEYIERILSGDKDFIEDVLLKRSQDFENSLKDLVAEIEKQYFQLSPVKYFGEEVVSVEEIKELFYKHYAYMPIFRRSQKIKRILIAKIKEKRDEKARALKKEFEEYKASLTQEQLLIEQNDIEFRRRIRIREIIREVMNSREALEEWIENESIICIYNKFNGYKQLTIDDLAPILYLMIKLEGKKSKMDLRHIVIDEAQDYTALQFNVIRELTGCKNFTIVGDVNQRLIKGAETAAMLRIHEIFSQEEVEFFNLNKSYRSTQEIIEYANSFLSESSVVPLVREGEAVETVDIENRDELIDEILEAIEYYTDKGYESIAIVTRNVEQLNKIYPVLREHTKLTKFHREEVIYNGGVVVIPSYFAKGLEFDAVIIVDFQEEIKKKEKDDLIKYIMATRALHSLKDINYKEK